MDHQLSVHLHPAGFPKPSWCNFQHRTVGGKLNSLSLHVTTSSTSHIVVVTIATPSSDCEDADVTETVSISSHQSDCRVLFCKEVLGVCSVGEYCNLASLVGLAVGRTSGTMLARDHWLLKASTIEEEAHVGILGVLPVIERVHFAEVVGNTGLLTIKFIGGLSQILPDTDKIVGCDESGVTDAAGT